MKNVSGLEAVYQDYKDKDLNFFFVYKSLAHPEINNFIKPHTLEERLKHIEEFQKLTGSEIPWLADSMDNLFSNAFGSAPNAEFVLDPEGKIVRQRFWSNPVTLRNDLTEFLGAVENPTSPEDALPDFEMPTREITHNVVPKIDLPEGLRGLVLKPGESEFQAYAKLRVEASKELLGEETKGQMYIGLYLDPLYKVHWNNRAGDIAVQIKVPDGMTVSEQTLIGPEVEPDADVDPRQFLVELDRNQQEKTPIEITVSYIVCDDAETFCHTITQSYSVEFRTEREMGTRPSTFMNKMFFDVKKLDRNGDGKIAGDEFPKKESSKFLSHMDYNLDNVIDMAEVDRFMSIFNNGRGFDSRYNDGGKPNYR